MFYLLIGITIVFFMLNYYISDRDYLAPAPVFCLMFLLSEIVILIFKDYFLITLHSVTVGILLMGFAIFTAVSYLEKTFTRNGKHFERRKIEYEHLENENAYELKPIHVNTFMVVLLIIVQLAAIIAFLGFLKDLMVAYNVFSGTLSERIDLYDKCTKFWPKVYSRLNVSIPMIYRICNPISEAGAYVMLFVFIHNFVATRKINVLYGIPVVLLCVLIVLNGSRSPLFRVLTFALILYYILSCRNRKIRRGSFKLLLWIGIILVAAGLMFFLMLQLMGRTTEDGYDLKKYLFIYTGAPIVNLDTWLTHKRVNYGHQVLGAQTFISIYNYIGKIFGISYLQYGNIDKFAYLHNIEIGNVYTIYYKMLYDFGAAGMIPVFALFAYYYEHNYRKIVHEPDTVHVMDYRLFIYVYLFNDLVMSFFSTRFYETILDAPFLKILLLSYIFWQVLIENRFDLSPQKITDFIFDLMKKFIKVPVSEYEEEAAETEKAAVLETTEVESLEESADDLATGTSNAEEPEKEKITQSEEIEEVRAVEESVEKTMSTEEETPETVEEPLKENISEDIQEVQLNEVTEEIEDNASKTEEISEESPDTKDTVTTQQSEAEPEIIEEKNEITDPISDIEEKKQETAEIEDNMTEKVSEKEDSPAKTGSKKVKRTKRSGKKNKKSNNRKGSHSPGRHAK